MYELDYEEWNEEENEDESESDETEQPELIDPEGEERPPFNLWCQQVDEALMSMTDFGECIETVGYFDWWEAYYREGISPLEAATQGLAQEILLEDERQ